MAGRRYRLRSEAPGPRGIQTLRGRSVGPGGRLGFWLLLLALVSTLTACRLNSVFRSGSQERAFAQRYVGKPFYTAMVLQPYDTGEGYLIDLSGELSEAAFEMARAPVTIPLGSRITLQGVDGEHLVARVDGVARLLRILPRTRSGTADAVSDELSLLLSETPPLQTVRPAMRPFVAQQQITRGMSRREVYMSWGYPDKVSSAPGSSGFLEEWVYFQRRMHLFLKDGFVTNWQQF